MGALAAVILALALTRAKPVSQVAQEPEALPFIKEEPDWYAADPIIGFIHPPKAHRHYVWPEHKKGFIDLDTNNMGLREDREIQEAKPKGTLRIIVTGDSHIDGVVFNSESFPHRLEQGLSTTYPNYRFEVINAAIGHYGPQHYLRAIKKYLTLKPDIFVVVVYSGNDFGDILSVTPAAKNIQAPPGSFDTINKAKEFSNAAVAQALNQPYYFKYHPELKAPVLETTIEQLLGIQKICRSEGIRFFVMALPTKLEVEWDSDKESLEHVSKMLGLTKEDLMINDDLRTKLVSALKAQGIQSLDLLPALLKSPGQKFWKTDYHLNDLGHQVLVDEFLKNLSLEP